MTTSEPPLEHARFRELTWKTKWLFVGAVFLAIWYSTRFFDRDWLLQWPKIVVLIVTGLAPQLFMLIFPFFTRDKGSVRRIRIPTFKRCLVEFAIAVPVVLVLLVALSGLQYLVSYYYPSKSLTPDAINNMAASGKPQYVFPLLVFSFTIAPIAEEVFFRGFVYNAFRTRMPTAIAVVFQSLIFGFCHFFGSTHAIIACVLGIVITVVYEWRKTLVTPVFIHVGINLISAIGVVALMSEYADRPTIGVVGDPDVTECIVREIIPGSAAFESGVMVGDLIVAFDDEPVATYPELGSAVAKRKPGDTIVLTLIRGGETVELDVTLKRRGNLKQPP